MLRSHSIPSSHSRSLGGRDDLETTLERTTPAVLALLSDGVPRPKRAIVAALAGRYGRDDVVRTLMRLSVTGRIVDHGGKFTLPQDAPAER